MEKTIKVASIQMDCIPGNVSYNIEKTHILIKKAVDLRAELVVLPELFDVGYDLELLKVLNYNSKNTIDLMSEMSKNFGVYIAGGVAEFDNNNIYNSVVVYNPSGELEAKYRKINLFCLSKEKEIFSHGNEPVTFSIGGITLGIMICYDIRFPELTRKYVDLNCSAIIISSAFPFPRLDHWRNLLKARAIENQVYIVASNRIGKDSNYIFLGNSCIIDPWGTLKSTLNETEEGVIFNEISIDKVNQVREFIPCLKDKVILDSILNKLSTDQLP